MPRDGELLSEYISETRGNPPELGIRCEIEINGQTKEYTRVAFLPNVNGQKYTIGTKFTSREEQGEFILLPSTLHTQCCLIQCLIIDANKDKPGVTPCQITVQDGKYFLTHVSPSSPVFMDGIKVRRKVQLPFGAMLGNKANTFLFMERKLIPEVIPSTKVETKNQGWIPETEFTPGQNSLILSHILSYLPFQGVKRLRLVSQEWNEEGFKLLRKQAFFCLVNPIFHSMTLFRYSLEMGDNPLLNWNIHLPPVGVYEGAMQLKLEEDLNDYIFNPNKSHIIKKLTLGGPICIRSDFQRNMQFIVVSQGHLQELELTGFWSLSGFCNGGSTFPNESITLPKLKVFKFSVKVGLVEGVPPKESDFSSLLWLKDLMLAINLVTRIAINCKEPPVAALFLKYLNRAELGGFPNLRSISILCPDSEVCRTLSNCELPLIKLVLGNLVGMTKQKDYTAFEELLSKHAPKLESLQFNISPETETVSNSIGINIPPFLNLKHLHIEWGRCNDIKLIFPGGVISYDEDFPRLKYLTLWPMELRECQPYNRTSVPRVKKDSLAFYSQFMPDLAQVSEDCQVVCGVQVLNILTRIVMECNGTRPLFSKGMVTAISKMFPNLDNKDWESIALKEPNIRQ